MHYRELSEVWGELTAPGQPFEIEEVAVRGQSLKAYKSAPPTVRAFWLSTAQFAERDYLVYEDERLTYGQAHAIVNSVAAWMTAHGAKPGDRVAVAMRNYPEWMLAYWACAVAGVACVGMNAWWTPDEMAFALADSAPKILIADKERLDRLATAGVPAGLKVVAVRTPPPPGAVAWSEVAAFAGEAPTPTVDPDDDMCIFYTSGTTGRPKGAQLTHRGCVINVMNMAFANEVMRHSAHRAAPRPRRWPPPIRSRRR